MTGPGAEVEACYRRALSVAAAHPNRVYELRAALSLARHWCSQNRRDEAREILASADSIWDRDLPDSKEARALLEQLS